MPTTDRIAEPWGIRTPYGPGEPWPSRVDMFLREGVTPDDVDRWVQSATTLHSNGDGLDIAVKDGQMVGVRRPGPGPRQPRPAGPQGPVRVAGERFAGPADAPAGPPGRRARRGVLGRGDGARRRERAAAARRAGRQRDRLLHHGTAVPRGVLHDGPGRPRRAGRQPRRREHAPVHRDGGRGAQGVLRVRRAAGVLHRHRPRGRHRAVRAQHGRDADGPLDPGARPARGAKPAGDHLRRPARDPRRARRDRPPGAAPGDERRADERPAAPRHRERPGGPRLHRRAHRRLRRARDAGGGLPAGAGGDHLRRAGGAAARGRADPRDRRAAVLHGAAGLLPGEPGDGGLRAGEQPADHPRHARQAGVRRAADERSAHGREHARVRRRRGPAGLPELVQRRPHPGPGGRLERRPDGYPALLPADPRDADDAVRRGRLHPDDVGPGHQPRRVPPGAAAHPLDPVPGAAVPRRAGHLPVRDRPARRRRAAGRDLGGEDGDVHERRPHRAPVGEGRRAARAGQGGPGHLHRLRPTHGSDGQGRRAAGEVARCRVGVRGMEGVHPRASVRLHRHDLRQAPRRQRNPVAVQRRAPRRHGAPVRERAVWAAPEYCESYGKDLITGAPLEPTEYKAMNPTGRAVIKAAGYVPPHEIPSEDFPLQLTTGRTVYHFHTRTKTARAPQLQAAAPEVWVEVSAHDADLFGLAEGDLAEVSTPRGSLRAKVRVSGIRTGVLFVPFHYGYWDTDGGHEPDGAGRAANELTITDWDPASKQPIFKTAAAAVRKVRDADGPSSAPTTTGSAPVTPGVPPTRGGPAAEADEDLDAVVAGGVR